MANYTPAEYIKELERRKKSIKKANIIKDCAFVAHVSQVTRMFEDEKGGDGGPLVDSYSTKYLTVGKANTPRRPSGKKLEFVPFSKSQRAAHGGKKGYYAYVFPDGEGYNAFKKAIGRGMFELFGHLKRDFATSLTRYQDHFVSGTRNEANTKKVESLVEKYGEDSFKLTQEERKQYNECVANKLNAILRGEK